MLKNNTVVVGYLFLKLSHRHGENGRQQQRFFMNVSVAKAAPSAERPPTVPSASHLADVPDLNRASPIEFKLVLAQCLNNPTFAIFLLEEFANTGNDRVSQMEAQLADQNLHELGEIAHSLRGTAGVLGASALAEASSRLEWAARGMDLAAAREIVPQIRVEMQRAVDDIPRIRAEQAQ